MAYFWAAYKMGKFAIVHPIFEQEMAQKDFKDALEWYIGNNALTPFTLFAEVKGKMQAVGLALFWIRGRIAQTENLIWFPWAKKRNILESYVNFVNKTRSMVHPDTNRTYMILEFAMEKDKGFFDHVCSYGIMRRVGTSYEVYPDQKSCIYESIGKQDAQ